ncbi:unnamed protein product [Victoria cruziana]
MEGQDLSFDFINLYSELLGAVLDDSQGRSLGNPPPISLSRFGPMTSAGLELQGLNLMNKRRRVIIPSPHQSAVPTSADKEDSKNSRPAEKCSGKILPAAAVKKKEKMAPHVKPLRRGQATESHRLAERARREKINERFRRLQSLVPGCDKSMGMAVMLDEIITYIQSLQNQVEFLCMKLESSSFLQHLNAQVNDRNTAANIYEALKNRLILDSNSVGGGSNDDISPQTSPSVATAAQKCISPSCQRCV